MHANNNKGPKNMRPLSVASPVVTCLRAVASFQLVLYEHDKKKRRTFLKPIK